MRNLLVNTLRNETVKERVWGTIGAMARCLLKTTGLPGFFYSFAYRAAFHIKKWERLKSALYLRLNKRKILFWKKT